MTSAAPDWRSLIAAGLLLGAAASALWLLPIRDWIAAIAETARGAGIRGTAIFFAAYIAWTVAMLPGSSLLTITAGYAYGPAGGLALASPASVTAATCAFLAGRTLLRGVVVRSLTGRPRARAITGALEREGFRLILLLRLSPVIPYNVLNYLLGASRVRLVHYVPATFLGMLPATTFHVYAGSLASTAMEVASGDAAAGPERVVLSLAGAAATLLIVVIAVRTARRALAGRLVETG